MTQDHQGHGLGYARAEAGDRLQDDRARISRARQAAEALFAPKRPISEPVAPVSSPSADPVARKPRILKALPTQRVQKEPLKAHLIREQPPPNKVPMAHSARIRAWLKYGMTVHQVAQVYGFSAGDIGRIANGCR
jgi:hypothetical protein